MMAPGGKLNIRRAGTEHAEMLTQLSVTTFRDAFGPPVNAQEDMDKYIADEMNIDCLTEELNCKDNLFFVAWYDHIPVGYVKLRATKIPEQLRDNKPMEIERLYVLQSYQSKRIGEALMNHCLDIALSRGHDVIWLGVWEHNYRAIGFYEKHRFELFGAHNFILGNDKQTDILMKRKLT